MILMIVTMIFMMMKINKHHNDISIYVNEFNEKRIIQKCSVR